jgi:hypothetical protein
MTGVPTYISGVIEATSLIIMLIFLLFTEFKIRWERK